MKFNSVAISPVASLEVGDLIAREFLGDVISGKITGIVIFPFQLSAEEREYMIKHELTIPEDEYEALGGPKAYLLFGTFRGTRFHGEPDHMYVDGDVNVAVFPYKP